MKTLFILGMLPFFRAGFPSLDTVTIQSNILDKKVESYIFDNSGGSPNANIIYFTDGKKLMDNGLIEQLQLLNNKQKIAPAYYVFVSTFDPDQPDTDHRNEYFFCNPNYIRFFEEELVPVVEEKLNPDFIPSKRLLAGISFGGLNAAYFAANSKVFQNYALLSPITYPCESVKKDIAFSENQDLKIFLSTGKLDAEKYLFPLEQIFLSKSYQVKVLQTEGNHDFNNWINQMEPMLNFFFE